MMKLIARFMVISSAVLAFALTFFSAVTPAAAGCAPDFNFGSITAYRDHIVISITVTNAAANPIQFTVTDGGTTVGSSTFNSVTTGSFTVEFDLNAAVVQELDNLKVDSISNGACTNSAPATATGFFYTAAGPKRILPECPDGRINNNNCDKIAIYPVKDEDSFGIQVYVVDHKTVPEFVLFVSAADLDALPAHPDTVIVVATSKNGLVVLYKHPNGDYQVNYGPDFEGKVFTFRFNGLPATSYPEVTTFMIGVLLPRLTPEIG